VNNNGQLSYDSDSRTDANDDDDDTGEYTEDDDDEVSPEDEEKYFDLLTRYK